MPFVTLPTLASESGYMTYYLLAYSETCPDATALAGLDPHYSHGSSTPEEWRGWLSFNTTAIPVGTVLVSARLVIPTVTTIGGERPAWNTVFTAADLDLDDLPTSWASDKGSVTVVTEGAPSEFDVDCDDIAAVLFNGDGSRIAFKVTLTLPALESAYAIVPVVETAKLIVEYGPTWTGVEINSAVTTEAATVSGLSTSSEASSSHADSVTMASSFASASAADSSLVDEVVLVSALSMEE